MSEDMIVQTQPLDAAVVFASNATVEASVAELECKVRALAKACPSVATKGDRDAIAALAYKVARSKTALDELGKRHGADLRKQLADLNGKRGVIVARLDALRDEVRKPLDEWEVATAEHEAQIVRILAFAAFDVATPSSTAIHARIAALAANPAREWGEFAERAHAAYGDAEDKLEALLVEATQREANAAELEAFRHEKAAREAAAAAEAEAEKARLDVEAKVARALQAANDKAAADKLALEKAAADRIAAAKQAEVDKALALDAALAAERAKVLADREAERMATEKREADINHRKAINKAVLQAMVAAMVAPGTPDEGELTRAMANPIAMRVIAAIVRGQVPYTRISY